MRIAWLGPEPSLAGGVPYAAFQILRRMPSAGIEVHAYITGTRHDTSALLAGTPGLTATVEPVRWSWGSWYTRIPFLALSTGQVARSRAQRRLARTLLADHRRAPFDAIYQFAQLETPWFTRKLQRHLPALVLHPEVHAAGELRWHRKEAAISRRCEPCALRAAVRAVLVFRAAVQRRHATRASVLIAPSERFADLLATDLGFPRARIVVVPNPIDTERFAPALPARDAPQRVELSFVSRMALRKGVEMIVDLSHRLADMSDRVHITCVGHEDLFSDYRCLLGGLNRDVATYVGGHPGERIEEVFHRAHAVLQPSHYEPFALSVGEALASGLPVVVSDEVGAGEGIDARCARVFAAGDMEAFERETRALVSDLETPVRAELSELARAEAQRRFATSVVVGDLAAALESVVAG